MRCGESANREDMFKRISGGDVSAGTLDGMIPPVCGLDQGEASLPPSAGVLRSVRVTVAH